jgi:hypothetical protein
MTQDKPMLHEIVECDGDRNGDGAFIGIVTRRNAETCHVLVGYTVIHWGRYGQTYAPVEYGARYSELRRTGIVSPHKP